MEWYYAANNQQQGPVSGEELERLVQEGLVRPETLVWRAGLTAWVPYSQAVAQSTVRPAGEAPAADAQVCSQCGQAFAADQLMQYGGQRVCANCKPLFLQRLREGGPMGGQSDQLSVDEVLARDYVVDVGESLSRGWALVRDRAGLVIGGTVLVYLGLLVANVIPYLSIILGLVFTGPLLGGLWLFYVRCVRGELLSAGDAFGGFGPRFGQLLLTHLVTSILPGLCMLPAVIALIALGVALAAAGSQGGSQPAAAFVGVVALLVLLGLPGFLYLTVCWYFALPLVIDKRMAFWPAMNLSRRMVTKHWWGTLGLMLVLWLVVVSGLLACLVGVLVTGPIAFAALAMHYEKMFGDLRQET